MQTPSTLHNQRLPLGQRQRTTSTPVTTCSPPTWNPWFLLKSLLSAPWCRHRTPLCRLLPTPAVATQEDINPLRHVCGLGPSLLEESAYGTLGTTIRLLSSRLPRPLPGTPHPEEESAFVTMSTYIVPLSADSQYHTPNSTLRREPDLHSHWLP